MNTTDWIRIVSIVITLAGSVFCVIAFCIIKFNDLYHIDNNIKETNIKLEKLDIKLDEQGEKISTLSSQISSIDGYIKGKQDNK